MARFSDAVRVRLNVDGKSVQGRVVADGKTAVEALHRLFASYACNEDYEAVEVAQFHSNEPRVFVPDEARYETRFLEIADPSRGLNR